jgi:hypothetical protein
MDPQHCFLSFSIHSPTLLPSEEIFQQKSKIHSPTGPDLPDKTHCSGRIAANLLNPILRFGNFLWNWPKASLREQHMNRSDPLTEALHKVILPLWRCPTNFF